MEKNGLRAASPGKNIKKDFALQIPPGSDSQIISVLLSLPEYSLVNDREEYKGEICKLTFLTFAGISSKLILTKDTA